MYQGYPRTDISGIDQALSFHLTHISLSFTVISFTPILYYLICKCLRISGIIITLRHTSTFRWYGNEIAASTPTLQGWQLPMRPALIRHQMSFITQFYNTLVLRLSGFHYGNRQVRAGYYLLVMAELIPRSRFFDRPILYVGKCKRQDGASKLEILISQL